MMRFLIVVLFALSVLALSSSPTQIRNLHWFEASGELSRYRSLEGTELRPVVVVFSHEWDIFSELIKKQIITDLKGRQHLNPILLEADCTSAVDSEYLRFLRKQGVESSLPIIGVRNGGRWSFVNPATRNENVTMEGDLVSAVVSKVIEEL